MYNDVKMISSLHVHCFLFHFHQNKMKWVSEFLDSELDTEPEITIKESKVKQNKKTKQ